MTEGEGRDSGRRQASDTHRSRRSTPTAPYRGARRKRSARALLPAVVLLLFGFIVAYQEIPAVADWWQRLVEPQAWRAGQLCRQAAIKRSARPAFARVLKPGKVHSTQDGLYVEGLVLGEMGATGTEEAVAYSCYLNGAGELVKVNRLSPD